VIDPRTGLGKIDKMEPLTPETEKRIALLFPPGEQELPHKKW
jgi:hypothetical protein